MNKTTNKSTIAAIDVLQFDDYYDILCKMYDEDFLQDYKILLETINFEFNINLTMKQLEDFMIYRIEREDAKLIYKHCV